MKKKKILISISDGMVERNLLKTDFLNNLLKNDNLEIIIFSSNEYLYNYLKKEYENYPIKFIYKSCKISKADALFNYLLRNSIHSKTVREEQYSYGHGINGNAKILFWLYCSIRICWHFGKFKLWRKALRFIYKLNKSNFLKKELRDINPDMVFVTSISPSDHKILHQASRLKIKTIQMIKSWDNLTSKTFLGVLPDYLIVHNEVMKKEAVKYDDMSEDRILVSGIPQFDYLIKNKDELYSQREEFYNKISINPKKKILLFSASGDRISPDEEDYILMIDDAIKKGLLPGDIHIHVRLHPKYKSSFKQIRNSENITIERPFSYISKSDFRDWIFKKNDVVHWYNSIIHSAMVINVASTMSIDAAVLDRPAVCLDFDGYNKKEINKSISRYYKREHYANLLTTGGVALVRSEKELIEAIKQYLVDDNKNREGRKRLVEQQCHKLDGNSSKRIADFLVKNLE